MPRFSAHISMLFTDLPFLDRFAAAAAFGFKGVDIMSPYDHPPALVADKAAMAGVEIVTINTPVNDHAAGGRGCAAIPGREQEFRKAVQTALDYCDMLECKRLHVLAGNADYDNPKALETYLANLEWAAGQCAGLGVTAMIEALSYPDYFLRTPTRAVEVIERVGHESLGLMYDVFHAQLGQGNIAAFIEENIGHIAHVQIAGVPDRNEPDKMGELNWPYLFDLLDAHGYGGWVGAEYKPRGRTEDSFAWARDWGIGPGEYGSSKQGPSGRKKGTAQ